MKKIKQHSLSLSFTCKADQHQYLKDNGATNIQYSGKTKTFYFNK